MWSVNSESGTLHSVLVQDATEMWEKKLPFAGVESSTHLIERCTHAQYRRGHEQWLELIKYLEEDGVRVFEVSALLRKIVESATLSEKKEIVDLLWRDFPEKPEDLTYECIVEGYPSHPYFDVKGDKVIMPDFKRVNWAYPRDTSFTTQVGTVISQMRRYSRKYEPEVIRLIFEMDPILQRNLDIIYDANGLPGLIEPAAIEGGDVLIPDEETICVGVGQRSTFAGFKGAMKKLFEVDRNEKIKYICAVRNPGYPAESFVHLDTVINFPDNRKILTLPYYWDSDIVDMPSRKLFLKTIEAIRAQIERDARPMDSIPKPQDFDRVGECMVYTCNGEPKMLRKDRSLVDFLIKEDKIDRDGIIFVGGKPKLDDIEHLIRAYLEQDRCACNIFAIRPKRIIAYERNDLTIEALEEFGIKVKRWDDSYLDLLGGPHCSTAPLWRDPD